MIYHIRTLHCLTYALFYLNDSLAARRGGRNKHVKTTVNMRNYSEQHFLDDKLTDLTSSPVSVEVDTRLPTPILMNGDANTHAAVMCSWSKFARRPPRTFECAKLSLMLPVTCILHSH